MAPMTTPSIAPVGYGEVGRIFGAGLVRVGAANVTAFDIRAADAAWTEKARARAEEDGVTLAPHIAEATADADLVISAVTAAKASAAAREIAKACRAGTFVLDVNSASPRTKRESAAMIEGAGARYVEAAIMNAVPPQGLRVPMLLGGPQARAALPTLEAVGFNASVGSEELGTVSAIKLCRSVVMKGMEALVVESLLAARRYGVEREVIASLRESYPGLDWDRLPTYVWTRVMQHGGRRAEEMRESAATVRDAGIEPRMASATAELQAWFAALRASGVFDGLAKDASWSDMAERIRAQGSMP
jgi:3-hydroxyisobutyrate dehydrogenase-like beta-hydroxyacid dehydrogenase